MEPMLVREKVLPNTLRNVVKEGFGKMVKVAVDVKKGILVLGGQWHSEGQELLVRKAGSHGQEVWGANVYPFEKGERRIEYIALINIKPAQGNKEMEIKDAKIRKKVKEIIEKLLLAEDETLSA